MYTPLHAHRIPLPLRAGKKNSYVFGGAKLPAVRINDKLSLIEFRLAIKP